MADLRAVVGFVLWILYFLLFNFETNMANMFIGMFIGAAFLYYLDKDKNFVIERPGNNRWKSIAVAFAAYVVFLLLSSIILAFFRFTGIFEINSAASIYSDYLASMMSQYSPALAGNQLFTFISWGDIIPIIETFAFFVVLYELIMDFIFHEKASVASIKTWLGAFAVAGIFALFHITAKGWTNEPALMMTFIFGLVSAALLIFFKQALEAVLFHIIVNSVSILISLRAGASITSPVMMVLVGLIILYFLVRKKRVRL